MTAQPALVHARLSRLRARVATVRDRVQATLPGRVWERLLEIECVDRSVALAGKAFVSFFPSVIVVAAFMPPRVRSSILTAMSHRLGLHGHALTITKEAFASSDDIRRATGLLGLAFTVLFASSFTTALQRTYLRAWRRPPGLKVHAHTRGLAWLVAIVAYITVLGSLRGLLGDAVGFPLFILIALTASCALWWFTAWLLLLGHVRSRVLLPTGLITGLAFSVYGLAAGLWMPQVVTNNEGQFGIFGVALALVTWFSGAAICVIVGACAGTVLAEDGGTIGALIRGRDPRLLVDGAPVSLPGPKARLDLRDAFRPVDDDVTASVERVPRSDPSSSPTGRVITPRRRRTVVSGRVRRPRAAQHRPHRR